MLKVFLVEDEIVIRESIQKIVPWKEQGFELVGEAQDGEMALPMIRELKPDVLITDIKMPFMDGLTLSKIVKKEFPDIKIIIVSGYDDFKYAQQAIDLGVEQYILKPISRNSFVEVLQELRNKFEQQDSQKQYYEKFRREMQEYEKNTRRNFFEKMVSGKADLGELYEQAESLGIDIAATWYNIVLFSTGSDSGEMELDSGYSADSSSIQEKVEDVFQENSQYILFRNQNLYYAVLIKADGNVVENLTEECVQSLERIFKEQGNQKHAKGWFVCTGKPVERLSMLQESYKEAMNLFCYRYMEEKHILRYGEQITMHPDETVNLRNIDTNAMSPEVIRNFLGNGLIDEVDVFVENYIHVIGEDILKSRMFRQYVLLNVHISAIAFTGNLGYEKDELEDSLSMVGSQQAEDIDEVKEVLKRTLKWAIELRDNKVRNKMHSVIPQAVAYIQENYHDESLNLSKVACKVNISANHFSAIFSQEMKQTFIEYLTNIRMNKAKELLRCSDMRSGEIAMEIGYKDSHYFSFLFKKTQGCTPSEYRKQNV